MPKDIFTHLVTPSFTRKIFKNLRKLCHVTTSTRERVHIPKLMRLGVFGTTMTAVYVFPVEKCFHIRKLSARISSKKLPHQKRVNVGTNWAGHPRTRTRILYTTKFKNAQNEVQASKPLVQSWYRKFRQFSKAIPNKTYAQALKQCAQYHDIPVGPVSRTPSKVPSTTANNTTTASNVLSKVVVRSNHSQTHPTVAGVPVKYGKCIPAKYSVHKPRDTVLLHNRFQCLQELNDSQDNAGHNIMSTRQGLSTKDNASVLFCDNSVHREWEKQRSEECKPPPCFEISHFNLARQEKFTFEGNKNKTGFLAMGSADIKQDVDMPSLGVSFAMTNVTSPTKNLGDQNMTFDSVSNHVSSERGLVFPDISGKHCKPNLAVSKIHLEGNKNEIGSLDGFSAKVRDVNKENAVVQVDTIAGASDSVSTADSHAVIDGNYDLNSLQLTECDDIPVAASNSEIFNVVTNQRHKFGFCPLSKLQLYTGESVKHSTRFTDLQAHKLVKASGKPNFLGCCIPVQSNLNIASWRSHLSEYWDAQLLDLLEFGFPLDFQRDSILVSTEKNHTSALQNLQHVQAYIEEELSFKAMLGPFDDKPIPLHVSPLMVRDKQDSSKKRTIMDLSWPKGASVSIPHLHSTPSGGQVPCGLSRMVSP